MSEQYEHATHLPLGSLGRRIRALRNARNMTLAQLANLSSISVAMLSHIERGRTSPSLKTLERLRIGLDVSLADFFTMESAADTKSSSIVVRHNKRLALPFNKFGLTKELLSPATPSSLEVLMLELEPGGSSGPRPWTRNGEKAGYVLEGRLRLVVNDDEYVLDEGDSFRFDSSKAHRFNNPGEQLARVIWIIKTDVFG